MKYNGEKQANGRQSEASPVSGFVPPPEPRWQPGQSGNPKGMKKGSKSITAALRRLLDEGLQGKDLAEAMAQIAYKESLKGNHKFWASVIERLEGKIKDESSLDVTVRVVYEDAPLLPPAERPMLEQDDGQEPH